MSKLRRDEISHSLSFPSHTELKQTLTDSPDEAEVEYGSEWRGRKRGKGGRG